MASQRIVPGEPSGKSITNNNTPFHRLNDFAASSRPNNGCVSATTRTSHGKTARNCCSLSPSLRAPARVTSSSGSATPPIHAGHKVRYFTAADLIDTLYRGLADNTVGKIIDSLLRADLLILDEIGFAPLDDTGTQLLFRLVAAAYERRSLAVASHWPFEQWGRFLPEHTTAASILDRLLHHASVVITDGESYRMRHAQHKRGDRP